MLVAAVGAGLMVRELDGTADRATGDAGATSTTSTAVEQPGPTEVRLVEDVAAHPRAREVRAVLQNHFDAINAGDYQLWTSTVTRDAAGELDLSAWKRQFRSTLEGNVVVHRIEAGPDGLVALLTFTSLQDPRDAPADTPSRCLRWNATYALTRESGELHLIPTAPTSTPHTPC